MQFQMETPSKNQKGATKSSEELGHCYVKHCVSCSRT